MIESTERLVRHALGVRWADMPEPARHAARAFLFDTLCVGVAGRSAPHADTLWALARSWGGAGDCPILGRPGEGASAPYAAFANAFQIHCQEFDCVHEGAVAHPMATVVAALLADTARLGRVDGETFLCALIAGVDVVATLGVAVTSPLRFFRPATAGVFGSVAALARLRGATPEEAMRAFGHALSFASGAMQAHLEGMPTLAIQVAGAARSAVEAFDLALAGIEAPRDVIDGPFGYLSLFETSFDLGAALDGLTPGRRITELSWKPFPTGRAAHGALVALESMIAAGEVTADTLETFVYRAPSLIGRLIGRRPFDGMRPAYARLCFAYLGAVTLNKGMVGLGDFGAASLRDAAVLDLAERIVVESDDNPDPAAFVPAIATATVSGGGTVVRRVTEQFGSPAWPPSRAELVAKARRCLEFGRLEGALERLEPIIDGFDAVADVNDAVRPAFG